MLWLVFTMSALWWWKWKVILCVAVQRPSTRTLKRCTYLRFKSKCPGGSFRHVFFVGPLAKTVTRWNCRIILCLRRALNEFWPQVPWEMRNQCRVQMLSGDVGNGCREWSWMRSEGRWRLLRRTTWDSSSFARVPADNFCISPVVWYEMVLKLTLVVVLTWELTCWNSEVMPVCFCFAVIGGLFWAVQASCTRQRWILVFSFCSAAHALILY